ncbi:hypothetical protein GALMADRAFT_72169 [Galerina marginata CBS 339.88]|uniref:Cyclin N-terminal domain-containing protein n=1 Tax=Galerina marginata (strain CBS 339.88) TaxID=685588 RepID=A0A067SSB1_GALM3|nr:hypothetical protein GALMADRAFT_72169 [Galerina marginata CBS 339.88]
MVSPATSTSSSSSASSSTSSIHHASLVDPALHSPALLELVDVKLDRKVIEYTIDRVVETVDYAMGRATASSSRGRTATRRPEQFSTFVDNVLKRAEVTMPTLLAALVYIDRARPHLHIGLEQWALERVFLGSLIVASKYLNDSTLKNVHWAMCTGVFGKRDVGRIEREYLDVLNFELKITEDDLLSHHQGLADAGSVSPRQRTLSIEPKQFAVPAVTFSSPASTSSSSSAPYSHSERRHTRRRAPTTLPVPKVPELSPSSADSSSPDSDSSYYSPRTPASDSSMDVDVGPSDAKASSHPHSHHQSQTKHQIAPHHPTTARKMINAAAQFSTMDLLRSFPIPRMMTTSA